jgi:hypothetical protein
MPLLPSIAAPMHGAVVPIAYTKLTNSTTGTITLSSIPQGYQDLFMVCYIGLYATGLTQNYPYDSTILLNTDANNSNYSFTRLQGNGSSATSDRNTSYCVIGKTPGNTTTSGTAFCLSTHHFLNYANTSTYKTIISRYASDQNSGDTNSVTGQTVALWRNTSGISQIVLSQGYPYIQNTTVELFGIRTVGQ